MHKDVYHGVGYNSRRLAMFQMSDHKKIIKKIETAIEYYTANNSACHREGIFTVGAILILKCKVEKNKDVELFIPSDNSYLNMA